MAKLIHIAKIYTGSKPAYLYLRQINPNDYGWFEEKGPSAETDTGVRGASVEEAMRLAERHWKLQSFNPISCGFKFTLPERDEHGYNALFYEMAAALNTMNGVYPDEELGHLCQIKQIPRESRDFYKILKEQNRL